MTFGDILKTKTNEYMVLDINHELQKVCQYYIDKSDEPDITINLDIPYTICKNLSNAVSFSLNYHN